MTKFTDQLWSDLVQEHGSSLAHADQSTKGRIRLLRRPRVLAGSAVGLAGVVAALTLGLGAATSTPAFAVTTTSTGSVLVTIDVATSIVQANAKLASMGLNEGVSISMASGPATTSGPVTCTDGANVSGPSVQVLVGTNGTEVIKAGQTGDNTGEGTFHLASCLVTSLNGLGNSGTAGV